MHGTSYSYVVVINKGREEACRRDDSYLGPAEAEDMAGDEGRKEMGGVEARDADADGCREVLVTPKCRSERRLQKRKRKMKHTS